MRLPSRIELFSAGIILSGAAVFGGSAYAEQQEIAELESLAGEFSSPKYHGILEFIQEDIDTHEGARNFFLGMLAVDGLLAAGYVGLEVAGRRQDRRA